MVEKSISKLDAGLRLLRAPNLLMIVLVLTFSKRFLYESSWSALADLSFWLFVGSVVCTAAAGYIINDYYDVKIDAINRPKRVVVGRRISRRQTLLFYTLFNFAGLLLALSLSFFLVAAVLGVQLLLWLYSGILKRIAFWGNTLVAGLSALPLLLLTLLENSAPPAVLLYAAFAFFMTLIREIVKDLEDLQGDRTHGCRTLAIVWGLPKTRKLIYLLLLLMGLLLIGSFRILPAPAAAYLLGTTSSAVAYFFWKLSHADTQKDFHFLSQYLKGMMLLGISSLWFL